MAKKIVIALWALFGMGIVAAIVLFMLVARGYIGYMPPIEDLQNPKDKFASEIYTSDMQVLGRYFYKANRVYVNYNQLSPYLVEALIATEDVRFYDHSGIDAKALIRAIIKRGLLFQKSAGGGSTISQQLAKLMFSPRAENVLERLFQKPIEWVISVQLERYYTKEEIVNMYLNMFDFLNTGVGIQSASMVYFNTTPDKLTIEQAATLIGMCKNPRYFNPVRHNERTRGRRNTVLEQMYKADYITKAERDSLQDLPLTLDFQRIDHKEGLAPYFREHLRLMMVAPKPVKSNYLAWQSQQYVDDSIAWETNPIYGWCEKNRKADGSKYNLYTDGLKIYTTLDSRMQKYAEEAVAEHIGGYLQPRFTKEKKGRSYGPFARSEPKDKVASIMERAMKNSDRYRNMKKAGASDSEIQKAFGEKVDMQVFSWEGMVDTTMTPMDSIRYLKSFLRTGFMAMDPRTGYIKAYVGGIDFKNFQYDMVSVGRRQVGSTIKPFLYTLAMEEGFSPCDLAPNVQPHLKDEAGRVWSPRNASKARIGEDVTLRWGLANSNNWISAYLMDKLSPSSLVRLMHSFGIKNKIDAVISLSLGPAEVSVEEMVTAYTAFANKGIRVDPLYVTRIEDNFGNVISEFSPRMTEVFSESAYYKILPMLRDVIDHGTGARIRFRYGITAPMGGKTGTTNNNADGWFMAFTPSLVSGMWVGGEDPSIHFDGMADGQGASMALPIYGLFIQKVYADKTLGYSQTEDFVVPPQYSDPCAGTPGMNIEEEYPDQPSEAIEGIFD
ncbi:transglycosylase domain-containing protein [Coprobacter tertius]|uniref:Transglycosylase domain-containing protein n=1 Tax=Coprobacter tertius TaxID=2944915 RepID=A0ABT1MJT3_9BACT|nr:transglycosylase domain-containing protein [Coprobacter tertius]